MFDNAPSVSYEEVCKVFKDDLGVEPTDMFESFSHDALASASIAQVHKAVLKPEHGNPDQVVAVKVQKPAIAKQMGWDLFSYKWVQLPAKALTHSQDFDVVGSTGV